MAFSFTFITGDGYKLHVIKSDHEPQTSGTEDQQACPPYFQPQG